MQFWHAIGLGTLPAHHADHVPVQFAGLEGLLQFALRGKHACGRLHHMPVGRHGRDLDHAAPQVARQQLEAARGAERVGRRAQHAVVTRGADVGPVQLLIGGSLRLARVFTDTSRANGEHVLMHQPGIEQLADHIAGAAGGLELVHVRAAVGVHARQQRHDGGQGGKVVPVDHEARRARHG